MIVGICGGTGSGKTTMANALVERIGAHAINLIEQDSYYKNLSSLPLDERRVANFDHPDSLDIDNLAADLKSLKAGNTVEIPVYDFTTHTRKSEPLVLSPKPVTVLEGILILSIAELREQMDIKVYLDTSSDTRLLRRIKRDIQERGRTLEQTLLQYETTIRPMHHEYVEPTKEFADIVVPEGGHRGLLVDMLAALIESEMKRSVTTI
ncbi:MAG: uridine kinase [Acidobacteriota bacterium]|nr:uridine kinase [Acidobacteriota bacterium]MDH3529485.1 uridine kinase [Acidobacteriota bacterium]